MFQPIKRKKLYVEIMDQLQHLINTGELKPGDKLMSERLLAEKLNVSRTSVREAFSALELMGVLESRPGEGTFISTVSSAEEAVRPLALMMILERDAALELLELRRILEGESAYLAAERATEKQLKKVQDCLQAMEEDKKLGIIGEEADADFHVALCEATGNRVLVNIMNNVSDLLIYTMKKSRESMFAKSENRDKLQKQHRNIFQAVMNGEPELARKCMHEHIDFVQEETSQPAEYSYENKAE